MDTPVSFSSNMESSSVRLFLEHHMANRTMNFEFFSGTYSPEIQTFQLNVFNKKYALINYMAVFSVTKQDTGF